MGGRRKDGGGVECSDNYILTYVFDGLDSPKGVCKTAGSTSVCISTYVCTLCTGI